MLKKVKNEYNILREKIKREKKEEKMRLDLIEVKPKYKKIKIIFLAIGTILLIALFSFLGIKAAESYNKKLIAKRINRQKQEQLNLIEQGNNQRIDELQQIRQNNIESVANSGQTIEKMNISKLPVYSENAKNAMKNIYKTDKKIAYLTFDDGPSQTVTPQILDLLKQENIPVTFFVLGKNVKVNPNLVKREYVEGHYIANHGYSHEYSSIYSSINNVLKEYNKTENEIRKAIGVQEYQSHLFRFPGGSTGGRYAKLKSKAAKELNNQNISYIDWNALTSDAAGANTKEKIIKNLKSTVKDKNSVVILMHDASNKILTYETLPDVIKYLREQGYSFDNFYSIMK